MPICQSCGKKWAWKQTIKTLFRLKCPYCGKKQYESASSRIRNNIFMLIPLLFLPINTGFGFTIGTAIIMDVILWFLIFGLYPFILKLSNEQESYW